MKPLDEFVRALQDFDGISRKYVLPQILTRLREESYRGGLPHSLGEDSAVIEVEKDEVMLLTTDSIVEELCLHYPRAAGFNVVLANVMDIYAAGGVPNSFAVALSYSDSQIGEMLLQGLIDGSNKFRVPIVRGHTNPRSGTTYVVGSAVGKVKRRDLLTSGGAQPDDVIMLIYDRNGKRGSSYKLGWDCVSDATSESVVDRLSTMNALAGAHVLSASKDVSVAGLVGTAGMMLEYSDMGGHIDMDAVEKTSPGSIEMKDWIRMYISLGFLVALREKNVRRASQIVRDHGMEIASIGHVDGSHSLRLRSGRENRVLFDFSRGPVLTPRDRAVQRRLPT